MTPTFTVIIPHKNIPHLLQRCLDSVPDTSDIEVIVVDDNSSTDVVDFDHFPGTERANTTCIFDKQGGGAGHARNVGLAHAHGRWLIFSDADDFFSPDAFDIFASHMSDPYDILVFKSNSVDSDDLSPANRRWQMNLAIDEACSGRISSRQAALSIYCVVSKMYRMEFVRAHDIHFDETRYSNDQMFIVKAICLASDKRVGVSDETVYTVTVRRGSLVDGVGRDPDNFLCRMEVHIRCNQFLKDYPQFRKEPMVFQLYTASRIGPKTFVRALRMVLSRGALFSGFDTFLRIVKNHLPKFRSL